MRIAIVSDIHGNLTAFEAVLADVRETSPDLILHGGDLADSGSSPAEIVDQIRDLGWQGVAGPHRPVEERPVRPDPDGWQSRWPAHGPGNKEEAGGTRIRPSFWR